MKVKIKFSLAGGDTEVGERLASIYQSYSINSIVLLLSYIIYHNIVYSPNCVFMHTHRDIHNREKYKNY